MVDRDSARTKGNSLAYFEQLEKQVPCAEFRMKLSFKFSKPSCTKNFNGEFYLITHPGEETHDLALPRSSYTWLYSCQLHIHHGKHSPNAPNNVTLIPSLPLPSLTHRDPRTSSESVYTSIRVQLFFSPLQQQWHRSMRRLASFRRRRWAKGMAGFNSFGQRESNKEHEWDMWIAPPDLSILFMQ